MSVASPPNSPAVPPAGEPVSHARSGLAAQWLVDLYSRRRWYFLGMLVLFYLAAFNGRWQPEPDSALYLSIGRNLARGDGYVYLGQPHTLAYPGMPYLIASTFAVFGIGAEWAPHVVVLLLTLAGLGLLYRLFYLHTDSAVAVFLTCMVGMTFTLFRYAFELRNDVPFTVGVLAFLVGLESWRQYLAARHAPAPQQGRAVRRRPPWYDTALLLVGLPLAMVMRPHGWVLLAAVMAAAVLAALCRPGRARVMGIAASLLIAVALFALLVVAGRHATTGTYEAAVLEDVARLGTSAGWRALGANAWELINATLAEAALGHKLGPGLTPLFGITLLVLGIGLFRRRWVWGLFVVGTFVMVILVLPAPRYLLPVLPVLALAWFAAMVRVNHRLPRPWGNVVFALMLAVWVVPNFLKITKLVAEQRSTIFAEKYGDAVTHAALHQLAGQIAAEVEPEAFVLAHRKIARVLAYWADRNVVAPYEMPLLSEDVPLYVVRPVDDEVSKKLRDVRLVIGQEIARQPVPAGNKRWDEDWVLCRLIEPTPATAHQPDQPVPRPQETAPNPPAPAESPASPLSPEQEPDPASVFFLPAGLPGRSAAR